MHPLSEAIVTARRLITKRSRGSGGPTTLQAAVSSRFRATECLEPSNWPWYTFCRPGPAGSLACELISHQLVKTSGHTIMSVRAKLDSRVHVY